MQSLDDFTSTHGVPLLLGTKVTVDKSYEYASEWTGEYVVLGIKWDQIFSKVNVTIGDHLNDPGCDGWEPTDLNPVPNQKKPTSQQ
ncbi:hypothetical protein [Aeromonas hydrophila]|uniref:hypothetical protein n=1 Tax=Aeromonas hydrophila TaxID=644 RepID=UPI002B46C712|nr:hypothetical protein [Aeromonas hydrophila]